MHYYKFHISDFHGGTKLFSFTEKAVYRMMLDLYYETEQPLPASPEKICMLLGLSIKVQKEAVKTILTDPHKCKFSLTTEGWRHEVCDRNIAAYHRQATGGKTGADKRWGSHGVPIATPLGTPIGTPSKPHIATTNHEPLTSSSSEGAAVRGDAAAAVASPGEGKPDPDAYLVPYVVALTAAGIGGGKREALARSLAICASPDVAKAAIEGIRKRHKEIGGKGTGALIGDVEAWIEQRSVRPSPALPKAEKPNPEREAEFALIPAELVPELEREAMEKAPPYMRIEWEKNRATSARDSNMKIRVIQLARNKGLMRIEAGAGVTR